MMSKSIYDEALDILRDSFEDPQDEDNDCYMLDFEQMNNITKTILQAQKQEKLIQKLKSNLISGHFEDKLEHTNKDDLSKMYNKGLYDMVNDIEEYILQEFKELENE